MLKDFRLLFKKNFLELLNFIEFWALSIPLFNYGLKAQLAHFMR